MPSQLEKKSTDFYRRSTNSPPAYFLIFDAIEAINLITPKIIKIRIITLSQISNIDELLVEIALRAGEDQINPSITETNKIFELLFIL
jgi:hypothetical protein